MNLIDQIIAFGVGVYEATGAVPARIDLPNVAHDQLKKECAARVAQKVRVVPGTISCIQIETGHGVIAVQSAGPEAWPRHGKDKT